MTKSKPSQKFDFSRILMIECGAKCPVMRVPVGENADQKEQHR
jgi:hypothetical protein